MESETDTCTQAGTFQNTASEKKKKEQSRRAHRKEVSMEVASFLILLMSTLPFAFSVNLTLKVNSRQLNVFKLTLHSHLRKHTQLLPKCSIGNNHI